ncbi:hypothetical protein AB5I41_30195 [Sphingomonas sp. MMS24-JH45]
MDFTIGRAIVNATVVLYDNAPSVVADAQVADMRYGPTVIQAARAKVNYTGGRGTAQALPTGSNGVPFRVAINSRLSPELYLVALQGQANGVNFRTPSAARIEAARGTYRLLPTRLDFDQGSMRLAGRRRRGDLGTGAARQARPVAGQRADPEASASRAGDGRPRLCPERGRGDATRRRAHEHRQLPALQPRGRVGTGQHGSRAGSTPRQARCAH